MSKPQWFKYVPHSEVHDYVRAGWKSHKGLSGTHHGVYSVLMEWTGAGEPPCQQNDSSTRGTTTQTATAG